MQEEQYVDKFLTENGRKLDDQPVTGRAFDCDGAYYWTCYLLTIRIPYERVTKKRIYLHIGGKLPFVWHPVDEGDVPGMIDFLNVYYDKNESK